MDIQGEKILKLYRRYVDVPLLLFLLFISHANPALKLVGLVILILSKRIWMPRMNLLGMFYLLMMGLGISSLLYYLLEPVHNYLLVLVIGCLFWLLCLGGHVMTYGSVKTYGRENTTRTIYCYFYIILSVTLVQYGKMLYETGNILPAGSSGDHIRSIFTFSSDAMLIYGVLFFYFLRHRDAKHTALALFAALCTNFMTGILILVITLGIYFFFFAHVKPKVRLYTYVFSFIVVFLLYQSPYKANFLYAYDRLSQVFSAFKPRKITAHEQTVHLMIDQPQYLFFGTGMGNFSSRLAFMSEGQYVNWYPQQWTYRSDLFKEKHFSLWNPEILKIPFNDGTANQPFSVYNQLLGEYGLAGLIAFIGLYLGFLGKYFRRISPEHKAMCVFMLLGLFVDYWFEYFSFMLIFEWLMLVEIEQEVKGKLPKASSLRR